MQLLNPELCPNHNCEMEERYASGRWTTLALICPECRHEMYERITKLKLIAVTLKRIAYISKWPTRATLFEGL